MKVMEIYNVKHGDFGAYLDCDKDYSCVLDCGSSQSQSRLHTACTTPTRIMGGVSQIINSTKKRDLLISHFHRDHYNGVKVFSNYKLPFFDKMYIPYIEFKADYSKQFIYSFCLLHETANILNKSFSLLKDFESLFKKSYEKDMVMVGEGDEIPSITDSKGNTAEIIWPPITIKGKSRELERFIHDLEENLRNKELDKAIKNAGERLEGLQDLVSSKEIKRIDTPQKSDRKEFDINELMSIEKSLPYRGNKNRPEIRDAFKKLRSSVKQFLNPLSIAFKIDKQLLWMGDLEENNGIFQYIKSKLDKDIKYFKLPHHGTVDINGLDVKASKFLVSLSDGKNYGPLDRQNIKKAIKDKTLIRCTDGHKRCSIGYYSSPEKMLCYTNTVISERL